MKQHSGKKQKQTKNVLVGPTFVFKVCHKDPKRRDGDGGRERPAGLHLLQLLENITVECL